MPTKAEARARAREINKNDPFHRDGAATLCHIDSCATVHLAQHRWQLTNVQPCSESFSAADGFEATATCMGDMPLMLRDPDGNRFIVTIKNVRHVPNWPYTLLSTKQMWAELGIRSRVDEPPCGITLPSGSSQRGAPANLSPWACARSAA